MSEIQTPSVLKSPSSSNGADVSIFSYGPFAPAVEYAVDAAQRSILFWDVMRQRSNEYHAHLAETAPNVLDYQFEVVIDGRMLARPVNYGLVRVTPPEGVEIDMARRPFVIVDPRAGHRPGIGGFKADSEIGVAMRAGHPCYLIGFLPEPMPGQTLEDVGRAEAVFLEKVIALHPATEGKPCVIGNCQAGWAIMMLGSVRPELFGPIIIAGSPLSYWDGVHGRNPMRYSGGLLGGSWLTALTSDLGAGKFDGAWLVQNFENLNPSNTLWTKQYNLYSKIDTEAERYLGFERYWGGHVNLNAEEIQFIVDQLFVGNDLVAGKIQTSDGDALDLRKVRSPIVAFCSEGDNITPPSEALGWIPRLYESVDDIRSHEQTIVYSVHEKVGHLGIFVSAGVAHKEYTEFSNNIDLIDVLPPGLYEAIFERKGADTANPDLTSGEWVMRCEERTLDDIRALGGNDQADDRCFAAAAKSSEINLALYRTFAQPFVRALANPPMAEHMRKLHPLRAPYELLSNANPMMAMLKPMAAWVREHRSAAPSKNPFIAWQETISKQIIALLDAWRDGRDRFVEQVFFAVYGAPALQTALGIDPAGTLPLRKPANDSWHRELLHTRIAELKARMPFGGLNAAAVRALVYAGKYRGAVDERGFEIVRRLRRENVAPHLSLAEFKALVREQFYLLLIDQETALAAIPKMLPEDAAARQKMLDIIKRVLTACGPLDGEDQVRLARITRLFGLGDAPVGVENVIPISSTRPEVQSKAS
jgi:hypothetical protein